MGGTRLRGPPGQCLWKDEQREICPGLSMPEAPAVSQLLCLALLEAIGYSACAEAARRMGSFVPQSRAPPAGSGVGGHVPSLPSPGGHF